MAVDRRVTIGISQVMGLGAALAGKLSRPEDGGVVEAHAATHETGGSDPIDTLDASVLTSGILDPARLPPGTVTATETAFTPYFSGSGGQSGQVYAAQKGYVVKVGNRVDCWAHLALTTVGTISGNLYIAGLPYAAKAGALSYWPGGTVAWFGLSTSYINMSPLIQATTAVIGLWGVTAAGTSEAQVPASALTNGSQIYVCISYPVL